MTVLLLAGSRGPGDPVARAAGVSAKALATVDGRRMIDRVIETLQLQPRVGRILVVADGNPEAAPAFAQLAKRAGVELLPQDASPAATVAAVLASLTGDAYPLLVTTADHPLLSAAMVDALVAGAPPEADLAVGMADAAAVLRAWPESVRTVIRLGGNGYCGCNLFLLKNARAANAVRFWQQMERNRKKPWRLVLAAGIPAIWRYATGQLDLAAAFRRLSAMADARIAPVLLPQPEAAIDVDKPEDLALVERILAERRAAGGIAGR